jgi:hypothetical protein
MLASGGFESGPGFAVVNVICTKWGDKYPPVYVNKLYGMVARNLKRPFRFVCVTDEPRDGLRAEVETVPMPRIDLPERQRNWPWRKVSLFAPRIGDLEGLTLFLDLDILVVGGLDAFFEFPGEFCVIENWTQPGSGIGNTSVYRFVVGAHADLYEHFMRDPQKIVNSYNNSQTFISRYLGKTMTFWPAEWVKSFKVHSVPPFVLRPFVIPKMPDGVRIVAFPGDPKMPDAAQGKWPGGPHKFIRKTPWIDEHWRE